MFKILILMKIHEIGVVGQDEKSSSSRGLHKISFKRHVYQSFGNVYIKFWRRLSTLF